eukprot:g2191.t1
MCLPAAEARAVLSLFLLLVLRGSASGVFAAEPKNARAHVQLAPTAAAMIPTFASTARRSRSSARSSITISGSWSGGRGTGLSGSRSVWDRAGCRGGRSTGSASLRCVCTLPPPGISPLAWDLGVSSAVGAASVVWVKLWTGLARRDKMKPQVSRKVVHTTAAPLFMVLWPFFTDRPCAKFFAAAVPLMQSARLAAAGMSGDPENDDASSNELVKAISRSGKASETLGGPLKYSLAMGLITALEWRTSVVGIIAVLQMAVGDGMADLVGRQFGKHKWRRGGEKSVEGSLAFASGSFLVSMAMIQWFHRFGMLSIKPAEAAASTAVVSLACAAVELLPPRLVGDDNISVPVTALVVDIVTDRNNLRNLLRFCRSPDDTASTLEFGKQDFKFFVHAIGDAGRKGGQTLVFTRAAVVHHNVTGYGHNFEKVLTGKEPGSPPDAGTFRVVVKMNLDGMDLLVRSEVDACERAGGSASTLASTPKRSSSAAATADNPETITAKTSVPDEEDLLVKKVERILLCSSPEGGKSKPSSGLTSTKNGHLLGGDAQVVELKTKNSRFADEINWRDIYWQLALGGAHKLVLGLHNRGTFGVGDVEDYTISEVKKRAGEPSMVFLANTLRDIIKAAHSIFATTSDSYPLETPAPRAPSAAGKGLSRASTATTAPVVSSARAVVVEYSPRDDMIRVRPANASDGAVAPS